MSLNNVRITRLNDVSIYDMESVVTPAKRRNVQGLVAICSEEGIVAVDNKTAELVEMEAPVFMVNDKLFDHPGPVALLLGFGSRDFDILVGVTAIGTNDALYRIIFTMEGFSIASIHPPDEQVFPARA